jgi:hypothetical protein
MDFDLTKKVLEALEREGVRYVVFGAVAINLLGLARATADLDLFIEPVSENVERLKAALQSVFQDPFIEEISAADLMGDYPAVQYIPPEGPFHLDILTRLGEAFRFQDLEAIRVDLEGLAVTVASPRTLYEMKKGTVRPKDWADAEALRRRFHLEDD